MISQYDAGYKAGVLAALSTLAIAYAEAVDAAADSSPGTYEPAWATALMRTTLDREPFSMFTNRAMA